MSAQAGHNHDLASKLLRMLRSANNEPGPKRVHEIRTTIRRLEVSLRTEQGQAVRGAKKLSRELKSLRRAAGHVRDIDVQREALKYIQAESGASDKEKIVHALRSARKDAYRKLQDKLSDLHSKAFRRRLTRHFSMIRADDNPRALDRQLAPIIQEFSEAYGQCSPLNEDNLHELRIAAKRARYRAEIVGEQSSGGVVRMFKHIQDAIGEWHDLLNLLQTAETVLPSDRPLIAAIRAGTRARFLNALCVTQGNTEWIVALLSGHKKAPASADHPFASQAAAS